MSSSGQRSAEDRSCVAPRLHCGNLLSHPDATRFTSKATMTDDDKMKPKTKAPKSDPLDDLTVRFEEGGVVQVEEVAKVVLASSPAWATLAFLARERDRETGALRAPRVSLRRYKKRGGRFVVDNHFTLTNRAQALALQTQLLEWFKDGGVGDVGDAGAGSDDDE